MSITTAVVMPSATTMPKAVNWGFGIAAVLCVVSVVGLLLVPLVIVAYFLTAGLLSKRLMPQVSEQARAAFSGFIGYKPKHFDVGWTQANGKRGITGTGVAYADRMLYMLDSGVAAKIPLADIREWRWEIPGYDKVIGYGDAGARTSAAFHTAIAKAAARANSGLFVSVKDVEHPEWHFRCSDKAVLDRWHEILTQASEGKL
jgi:hypothetical protein